MGRGSARTSAWHASRKFDGYNETLAGGRKWNPASGEAYLRRLRAVSGRREDILTTPLLTGLTLPLERIFRD